MPIGYPLAPNKEGANLGIDDIKTVGVVGAGTMGAQIAQQTALGGYEVWLADVSDEQLQRAVESNRRLIERRVEKQQMSRAEADGVRAGGGERPPGADS